MSDLAISQLASSNVDGSGTFDVLMRAMKTHIDKEFLQGRMKGPEYAEVYLGSVNAAMQTGLQFLLTQKKIDLEAALLAQQIQLATVQVQTANAELAIAQASLAKVNAEVLQSQAQTALVQQQKTNAVTEETVLAAQACKLQAEFDLTLETKVKTAQETTLLAQKVATEKAQITAMGVDDDSVVGRQKSLYVAQTDGFKRDAEQKAAKLMADTWSVRRTTDDGTVADATNNLNDAAIGRAITKLLSGVGA
jgi:hypothetical protein